MIYIEVQLFLHESSEYKVILLLKNDLEKYYSALGILVQENVTYILVGSHDVKAVISLWFTNVARCINVCYACRYL